MIKRDTTILPLLHLLCNVKVVHKKLRYTLWFLHALILSADGNGHFPHNYKKMTAAVFDVVLLQ